jgi:Tol biopolymer transport system component
VAFVHTADLSGPDFDGEKTGGGVYVRDLEFNQTERVSFRSTGVEAQRGIGVAINEDGRYVAFDTFDIDMVAGVEESGGLDVFLRDRQLGLTEWISTNGTGDPTTPGHSFVSDVSADGRYVMFSSQRPEILPGDDTLGHTHLFLRDRLNDTTERVDVNSDEVLTNGTFAGETAALGGNGRYVLFEADGSNLAPGDTNGTFDIFLRDRQAGATERVSLTSNSGQSPFGGRSPALSADGRIAAFWSTSSLTLPEAEPGQLYAATVGDPLFNRAPNADAGDDRTVRSRAAKARVRLDGFRSSDPDEDQLTFIWREGKRELARGVNPVVRLKKGLHAITLEVRDPFGAADTDDVLITVKHRR